MVDSALDKVSSWSKASRFTHLKGKLGGTKLSIEYMSKLQIVDEMRVGQLNYRLQSPPIVLWNSIGLLG